MFDCPMRGRPVRWEVTHTFNPAAVVREEKGWLLYRAEDDIGRGIGWYISRLGLAASKDGLRRCSSRQMTISVRPSGKVVARTRGSLRRRAATCSSTPSTSAPGGHP